MLYKGSENTRCVRYNEPGHAHSLTFSCFRKQKFLVKELPCGFLAESIAEARGKHRFDLWAYVFMPDHVHLLIWPREGEYFISSILQTIKLSVSRKAIFYLKKNRPADLRFLATGQKSRPYRFWQDGGGYDRNVTSKEVLLNEISYMHNNPVRKELVTAPTEWLWSSARDWIDNTDGPIPIDMPSVPWFYG